MFPYRDFVDARSFISYAANDPAMFRSAAIYVDKILKGAKPAELPVEQPTECELVVNLKTAKALGLTIPQSVLVRADEVCSETVSDCDLRIADRASSDSHIRFGAWYPRLTPRHGGTTGQASLPHRSASHGVL
jgi:hypothetical protein